MGSAAAVATAVVARLIGWFSGKLPPSSMIVGGSRTPNRLPAGAGRR
jgi:hypothetical protein